MTLAAQVSEYNAAMLKAAQATKTVGTEAEKLAQRRQSFEQLGRAAMAAGGLMAAGVGLAVKRFSEFDAAMSNVAATGEDARNSIQALRDAAIEAGASTVYSATESANAIEELAKAGISAADILSGGLNGALDLAAAGGLGVAQAAEIAATTMQQFQLSGSDASHVADLLAAGAGKAMGDVTDMGQALNQAGLVANQFGVSVEESVGVLSAFASAGMLGSDAGTSMRTMLLRLANPTKEVTGLMEQLGINAYDSSGQFVGLAGLAGELETSLAGMSEQQKQTTLAMIFGQDAIRGATILLDEGAAGIQKWTDKVNDQGYAAETARTKLDNLKGDIEALGGAFDSALISMGEGANGPLRALTQSLTEVVDGFNGLPDWAQQATLGVGALAGAAGLAGGAFFLAIPKIAEFNAALLDMGPGAQRAGRALGAVSRVAGAAAGFVALTVAAASLASALGEVDEKAKPVETTLKNFLDDDLDANFDGIAAEATDLASALELLLGDDLNSQMERFGSGLNVFGLPDQVRDTRDQFENMGEALAQLVNGGESARAAELFGEIASKAEELGFETSEVRDLMPAYQQALDGAANSATLAADGTEDAADAAVVLADEAQTAAGELDSMRDALDDVNGAAMSMYGAIDDSRGSLNALVDAAKTSGASLKGTNDESIRLRDAMRDVEQSHRDAAAEMVENGRSVDDAMKHWRAGRDEIIETRVAMGESGDAAAAWADKQLGSAEDVKSALAAVKDAVDAIPSGTTVNVDLLGAAAVEAALQRLARDRYATIRATVGAGVAPRAGVDVARAAGGAVFGPGTATSDSIPAMLSNGEHVLTAADVAAAGGHDAIYRWRESLHGAPVMRYAKGGKVSYKIDPSEMVDWRRERRRGEVWDAAMGGNAISLVDRLFDIAADIGGKYGKRLRDEALRSEGAFRRLEKASEQAEAKVDKTRDRLLDLRDAAADMASRVASAVRSIFNVADLAITRTVTKTTGTTSMVNGVPVTGTTTTTSEVNATSAKTISASMKKDAKAIKRFGDKLKRLAKKGLNPKLLEEIALLGIEQGEPIVDALLEASKAEIASINSSYKTINSGSNAAGKTVADANYEKLIKSAEDQYKQAKADAKAIRDKLEKETTRIVRAITDGLKAGTKPIKKAAGGPVFGPGTATSDSIPAFLSNGENVWSAAQVQAHGGQAAVERLKYLTPTAARYAHGGPVGGVSAVAGPLELGPAVISDASMERFAGRVAQALVAVRSADGREAVLATQRGVRG